MVRTALPEMNNPTKAPYLVWINLTRKYECQTAEEAWAAILRQPFGALYAVYDADGRIRQEFVPY